MPRPSPSTLPRPILSRAPRVQSIRVQIPSLPDDSPVKAQFERMVRSRTFRGARRSQLFLRYILHHAVAHPNEPLKEYSIALDVFDRDTSYDPAVNNTVRVEAGRLRSRLLEYYAGEGQLDPLLIEVPKGSYRVLVGERQSVNPAVSLLPLGLAALPLRPIAPARLSLLALPLVFLLGAFVGYRASH